MDDKVKNSILNLLTFLVAMFLTVKIVTFLSDRTIERRPAMSKQESWEIDQIFNEILDDLGANWTTAAEDKAADEKALKDELDSSEPVDNSWAADVELETE